MPSAVERIQFRPPEQYKPGDIVIPASIVDQRVGEMAEEVARDLRGTNLLLVGLLKGGYRFTTDLSSAIHGLGVTDIHLSFITVSSYGDGMTTTEEPKIVGDMDISPAGRATLWVDDILDTGHTANVVDSLIRARGVASLASAFLLDKPDRRIVPFDPTYVGFRIPNVWVQGRGMDSYQYGRAGLDIVAGPYLAG